ncbi:hypothetical protein DI272_43165 [Streptomyces sp. Act143]|uniref:DUF6332 family protein n=1 Tax=Streptomyces sp. Act143 TaxID=2200760 RepID=UPI000D67C516|nr:DUF6332 family protein [Streptomyces sp. Act143]PWI20210.1 hypothetical protein DI272_43165 [Streptomyces sp. Act143]
MTTYGGRPDQARRDAVTVEIGYALFSAAFATAVVCGAIAGPALLFDLPDTLEKLLVKVGIGIAPVLFVARVVSVLMRFRQDSAQADRTGTRPSRPDRTGTQPSQPGRTNPDS